MKQDEENPDVIVYTQPIETGRTFYRSGSVNIHDPGAPQTMADACGGTASEWALVFNEVECTGCTFEEACRVVEARRGPKIEMRSVA